MPVGTRLEGLAVDGCRSGGIAVEPLAHRHVAHRLLAARGLSDHLPQQPRALGDDVVLVDRLQVLLPREQVRMALIEFADFEPDTFVMARQENLETIHQHNVVAERSGLLGEMRAEAEGGERIAHHVTMREWLDGYPAAPTSVQG